MQQRTNYDSAFCGSLPLHLINQVQPYGVLLVLQKTDLAILQVSENIEAFTGLPAQQVVGDNLSRYISKEEADALLAQFEGTVKGKIPVNISFKAAGKVVTFLGIFYSTEQFLIAELEPAPSQEEQQSFVDVYQQIKIGMSAISQAATTIDACQAAAKELKRVSGFDKIMIYQFDEEWNGTVITEIKDNDQEAYLGLRFPASDVPKQTRELYHKNPYRLIPSRDYQPVKIYPVINPLTNTFIDLSLCNLRSVAGVHIEYLKNMGVMASMSTAIFKDEKLWGLISCHHKEEKYLPYETCSVFELIAGVISAKISSIQNQEAFDAAGHLQHVQARLVEQVYLNGDPVRGLINHPTNILHLLDAEGAVIIYNNRLETVGKVPGRYELQDLVLWLQENANTQTFATNSLSQQFGLAENFAQIGSGMIALPIHPEKGEYIIGFRPEVIQTVNWGGNPNEAIQFEKDNVKYHPRNSFKLWQQTVKQTSLPWKKYQVEVAEAFRNFLIEYTLRKVYA